MIEPMKYSCRESCGGCGADIGPSTVFVWHFANEDCRAVREPVVWGRKREVKP